MSQVYDKLDGPGGTWRTNTYPGWYEVEFSLMHSILIGSAVVAMYLRIYILSASTSTQIGPKSFVTNWRSSNVSHFSLKDSVFVMAMFTEQFQIWKRLLTSSRWGPICTLILHALERPGSRRKTGGKSISEILSLERSSFARPMFLYLQLVAYQSLEMFSFQEWKSLKVQCSILPVGTTPTITKGSGWLSLVMAAVPRKWFPTWSAKPSLSNSLSPRTTQVCQKLANCL